MAENESYIRWQNIRITQLGFANNLLILLNVALLGFYSKFLSDCEILNNYQKFFICASFLLIIVSTGLGIFVMLNRLEDFKLTAQIARKRETNQRNGIENDREEAKILGERTYNYFIWQAVTFLCAFITGLIVIVIEFNDKLF
ncbi:hypothetical protein [Flavobacterium hibernum]|uniref:Uncharacterized protein n=1 Tax=Flavobacterium hibernum TaxID=37752 RepID=A0A0D0ETH6_9FLAO|nr:hypothetical protein [Flavobacterium hibernum]KIO51868.1 hypothetical protein IW18_16610 [Flavobacterium hibernum]OXA84255.1 hypothetical protein B0A73_20470 [Flavobacterium hibernum]STO18952.1 Uncharacterised protein [Flavobacterium hibernum]